MREPDWAYDLHFLGGVDAGDDDPHVNAVISCLARVPKPARDFVINNVVFLRCGVQESTLVIRLGQFGSLFAPRDGDFVLRVIVTDESPNVIFHRIADCFRKSLNHQEIETLSRSMGWRQIKEISHAY